MADTLQLKATSDDMYDIIDDDKKVGEVGLSKYDDEKALGIGSLEIKPEYRNHGLGSRTIKKIIEDNKGRYNLIYCYVDADNDGAIKLYKKLGKVYDDEPNADNQYYVEFYNSDDTPAVEYDPPYNAEQIKKNYGIDLYQKLIKDPVHKWRMETGIELIHKEPSLKELNRIWNNWQLMADEQKAESDKKCKELFGCTNEENYNKLIKTYNVNESFKKLDLKNVHDPVYVTDESQKVADIIRRGDCAYRIFVESDSKKLMYYFTNGENNITHWEMMKAVQAASWTDFDYVNGDEEAITEDQFIVTAPYSINKDAMVYGAVLSDDGYISERIYDFGEVFVRSEDAYNWPVFKMLGKPIRTVSIMDDFDTIVSYKQDTDKLEFSTTRDDYLHVARTHNDVLLHPEQYGLNKQHIIEDITEDVNNFKLTEAGTNQDAKLKLTQMLSEAKNYFKTLFPTGHGFDFDSIKYTLSKTSNSAGDYSPSRNELRVTVNMANETDNEIKNTIYHEFCHYIANVIEKSKCFCEGSGPSSSATLLYWYNLKNSAPRVFQSDMYVLHSAVDQIDPLTGELWYEADNYINKYKGFAGLRQAANKFVSTAYKLPADTFTTNNTIEYSKAEDDKAKGHGKIWQYVADCINKIAGTNITRYYSDKNKLFIEPNATTKYVCDKCGATWTDRSRSALKPGLYTWVHSTAPKGQTSGKCGGYLRVYDVRNGQEKEVPQRWQLQQQQQQKEELEESDGVMHAFTYNGPVHRYNFYVGDMILGTSAVSAGKAYSNFCAQAAKKLGYRPGTIKIMLDKSKIKLVESLTEDTRIQLVSKSRNAGQYKDQSRGKNRFERKRYSKIATQVKQYNKLDMNMLFKQDILQVVVPVTGETDNYEVTVKIEGVVAEIAKNIKNNKNDLEFRTIIQALTKMFNTSNVYVKCTCDDFKYNFEHWSIVNNFGVDDTAHDPGPGKNIRNPHNDKGVGCKHIMLVLDNGDWMMKVASVINNYIHFMADHKSALFLKLIFPKLYGIPAEDMVEKDIIDDTKYLKSSTGLIDAINAYGKNRGKIKSGTNKNPVPNNKQGKEEEEQKND